MKIEAGKYYKTRAGGRVFVCATNKPGPKPIVGWIDGGEPLDWHSDGGRYSVPPSDFDIISEWRDELVIPWDKLFPTWVKWFAVDEDGLQCGFQEKPSPKTQRWQTAWKDDGVVCVPIALRIPFTGNWKESLTKRK